MDPRTIGFLIKNDQCWCSWSPPFEQTTHLFRHLGQDPLLPMKTTCGVEPWLSLGGVTALFFVWPQNCDFIPNVGSWLVWWASIVLFFSKIIQAQGKWWGRPLLFQFFRWSFFQGVLMCFHCFKIVLNYWLICCLIYFNFLCLCGVPLLCPNVVWRTVYFNCFSFFMCNIDPK